MIANTKRLTTLEARVGRMGRPFPAPGTLFEYGGLLGIVTACELLETGRRPALEELWAALADWWLASGRYGPRRITAPMRAGAIEALANNRAFWRKDTAHGPKWAELAPAARLIVRELAPRGGRAIFEVLAGVAALHEQAAREGWGATEWEMAAAVYVLDRSQLEAAAAGELAPLERVLGYDLRAQT